MTDHKNLYRRYVDALVIKEGEAQDHALDRGRGHSRRITNIEPDPVFQPLLTSLSLRRVKRLAMRWYDHVCYGKNLGAASLQFSLIFCHRILDRGHVR
jgi:hypothetical protein